MPKPKILFILPSLRYGGAERVVLNIVQNLDREKFESELAVFGSDGEYQDLVPKNIKFFDLKKRRARYAILPLIKLIRKEKPDIIFGTIIQVRIILSFIKKIFKIKGILVNRIEFFPSNTIYSDFENYLSILSCRYSDYLIAISEGIKDDLVKNYKFKEEKIKLIYSPVDIENIENLAEESVEEEYFSEKPVILSCGRLTEQKGFPYLIKAFFIILKEYPKAKLLILGKGEEEKELKNLIKNLNIENRVDFLGFQKNPYKFIVKADVFVLSSLREGLPGVLLEAMTCGCPVVSTDCQSGPSEILESGKYGILVPVADSKALAKGILKLLSNQKLREKFSRVGKERTKDFETKKIIRQYENFFLEILNKII